MSGKVLVSKEMFIIFVIKGLITVFACLIILEGIPSIPVATSIFILSIIFSILSKVSFSNLKGSKSWFFSL